MGIISKLARAGTRKGDTLAALRRSQRALGKKEKEKKATGLTKQEKKKAVEKETARVRAEAQAGAKKAKRGVQPEKVAALEKKVLPAVSKVRSKLKGLSAADIAKKYTGKEIMAMQRKIKDPRILNRLQRARKMRHKVQRNVHEYGFHAPSSPTNPALGREGRGAQLSAKFNKKGGTVKRKSGGKMNTDGNTYVASLYKGGKVGG